MIQVLPTIDEQTVPVKIVVVHGTVIDCRWQFFVPMSHVLSLQYGQNLKILIFQYSDILIFAARPSRCRKGKDEDAFV